MHIFVRIVFPVAPTCEELMCCELNAFACSNQLGVIFLLQGVGLPVKSLLGAGGVRNEASLFAPIAKQVFPLAKCQGF